MNIHYCFFKHVYSYQTDEKKKEYIFIFLLHPVKHHLTQQLGGVAWVDHHMVISFNCCILLTTKVEC